MRLPSNCVLIQVGWKNVITNRQLTANYFFLEMDENWLSHNCQLFRMGDGYITADVNYSLK